VDGEGTEVDAASVCRGSRRAADCEVPGDTRSMVSRTQSLQSRLTIRRGSSLGVRHGSLMRATRRVQRLLSLRAISEGHIARRGQLYICA
jgi:hypothetical protein